MMNHLYETIIVVRRWRELRHRFGVCGHDLPNDMVGVWNLAQGVNRQFLDQVRT